MTNNVFDSGIALSFDVEDWFHTPVITGYSFSRYKNVDDFFKNWKERYDYLTEPFERNIQLLTDKNIRATFFLVADILDYYPKIAKVLKVSGHEIACHSLHHQIPVNTKTGELIQSQEAWHDELILSKKKLEDYFEREVIGYRAPGAFFTSWMARLVESSGFKYDSSVAYNSLYNKTDVALRNISTVPYFMDTETLGEKNEKSGLVQLPWSYYELMGFKLPLGGAFFYRLLGNGFFTAGLKQCLSKGDTMLYMHPLDFSNETFPLHNHWKRPAYWLNKGDKSLMRLSKLIDKFNGKWITCGEVYQRFINAQNR